MRIFRGAAPMSGTTTVGGDSSNRQNSDDEENDGTSYAPGVGAVGKKPKQAKEASYRDKQLLMKNEYFAAKVTFF